MRGISEGFINELNEGILKQLLDRVKKDDTLDLQIREDTVNIYYRGGNLLKISDVKNGEFTFFFDKKYLDGKMDRPKSSYNESSNKVENADQCRQWTEQIPAMKEVMDFWFGEHPKLEREMQQIVVRENNHSSIANGTDFFIADMEYAGSFEKDEKKKGYRFDMLAVRWPATSAERKKSSGLIPCFIEMKYGDNAMGGKAGLEKHFEDMSEYIRKSRKNKESSKGNIYDEIENILTQKQKLGLFDKIAAFKDRVDEKTIRLDREATPYCMLILANTNPRSKRFENAFVVAEETSLEELKKVAKVKIANASYMGYGLYEKFLEEI